LGTALIAISQVVAANDNPESEWNYKTQPGQIKPAIGLMRCKVLGESAAIFMK
jgi:choline dehydrogenase